MRKPAYPLAAVLRFRERRRELARECLARELARHTAAVHALEAAERILTRRITERDEAEAELFTTAGPTTLRVAEIQRRASAVDALREHVERDRAEVTYREHELHAAQRAVAEAQVAVIEASRQVEAIEKHRERWRAALLRAGKRQEARLLSEISLNAFTRNSRSGPASSRSAHGGTP